jgi:hypothetical protein
MTVDELLSCSEGRWSLASPASASAVERLVEESPFTFPPVYQDLLLRRDPRWCDVNEKKDLFGQVRRDAEPDRAPFLKLLGLVSLLVGGFALLLVFPCLMGLPLGLVVCRMAVQDLDKMQGGLMDPRAKREVEQALRWATVAVILNLSGLGVFFVLGLVVALLCGPPR